jgi:squalene-associated FAD-dependent desaturase
MAIANADLHRPVDAAARPVIVGAGWSGLACAIELVRQGHRPTVLDAAPHTGGRARAFTHDLGGRSVRLDNGQHLLIGAYSATLELLATVGVDPTRALRRSAFALTYPDGWRLAAAPLPAPWHLAAGLLGASRMSLAERWSLASWPRRQARSGWRIGADAPASTLFAGEPAGLVRRLWRPLCLAALNVELEHASARMLLNVLRASLGGSAAASDLLLPRTDLSSLFPDAAARWLQSQGAELRLHCPVQALQIADDGGAHTLHLREGTAVARHVVLALPPDRAHALLAGCHPALDATANMLQALRTAPITTVYLRYRPGTRLEHVALTLLDDPGRGQHGQWAFDRGALDPAMDGIVSVVISGDGRHRELSREALGAAIARQLSATLGLPAPLAHYAITEKHATIVPGPGLQRPGTALPVAGLYLAGDAADSTYPSTIEGSVRAGMNAAKAIGPRT